MEPRRDVPVIEAAHRLRLTAATAEVVAAFDACGIPCILLKGASLEAWLYTEGSPRTFGDCDLLLSETDRNRASGLLAQLGFTPRVDEGAMPTWWLEHAVEWYRARDGVEVDLHRSIPGVGVGTDETWSILSANTEAIVVGGVEVRALTVPGRAAHLALHAAQHGRGEFTWKLEELARAVELADDRTWATAAALAEQLGATAAFCAGLELVPAGADLVARLHLDPRVRVDVALRAAKAPPVALGFNQLAEAPGWPARAHIVWRKFFPPATFMRTWDPAAHRGRVRLLMAYARRPFWLVRRAPAGYRAWRRARRGSTESKGR